MKILTNKERDEILDKLVVCQELACVNVKSSKDRDMIIETLNDIAYVIGGMISVIKVHDSIKNKIDNLSGKSITIQTAEYLKWNLDYSLAVRKNEEDIMNGMDVARVCRKPPIRPPKH